MTWKIKPMDNGYLVTCKNKSSFLLNNKHDAEKLCEELNKPDKGMKK